MNGKYIISFCEYLISPCEYQATVIVSKGTYPPSLFPNIWPRSAMWHFINIIKKFLHTSAWLSGRCVECWFGFRKICDYDAEIFHTHDLQNIMMKHNTGHNNKKHCCTTDVALTKRQKGSAYIIIYGEIAQYIDMF